MNLYAGSKKLKVNLDGKTYKIMNTAADLTKAYAAAIISGSATIEDVPETIKPLVEALLNN